MNHLIGTAVIGIAALAAVEAQPAQPVDPPGRVARLSYIDGAVSFQPGGVDDWVQAVLNRPLTTGDHLWADDGARAELHIGSAALRLGPRTAFEFLNLDDNNAQIRLAEGSVTVRLRRLDDDESFEVDTPNLAFSVLRAGEYRIEANPDTGTTTITVRLGQGEVTGGNQAFAVYAHQQAQVTGDETISYQMAAAPPPDDWDRWCAGRDRRADNAQSLRYVPREMIGYEDLDEYGYWREVPEYGWVWAPRAVVAGWAPYRYGHWIWVEPWGWTWVDDAPWGFAPFHYGRWAFAGGAWVWVPGPVTVRPVYAPALVAWVGGPHFSLSVSFGAGAAVAWFPLGPREVYVPAYRASPRYVTRVNTTNTVINNINVTNVYNVTNVRYVNREAPGAVTVVPSTALVRAQPVASVAVQIRARELSSAPVMNTAPVAPERTSVLGRNAEARVLAVHPAPAVLNRPVVARNAEAPAMAVRPAPAVFNRPVVARNTPAPPQVPFEQRQHALAENPGHPLDAGEVQRIRSAQLFPVHPMVRPAMVRPAMTARPTPQYVAPQQPAGRVNPYTPQERGNRPERTLNEPANQPANQPAPRPTPQYVPPQQPNGRVNPYTRQERPNRPEPTLSQPGNQPGNQPAPRPTPRMESERPAARPEPQERRQIQQQEHREPKQEKAKDREEEKRRPER